MPGSFTVQIPVSPYVKKFVVAEFGNPVRISNYNFFGIFIIGVLQKENFSTRLTFNKKNLRYNHFTEKITCVAPISLIRNLGYHVSDDHIIQINRFFEYCFDRELYYFVKQNTNTNTRYAGYKQAIEKFAFHYDIHIENEVSFEALKKMEYRYRKTIIKKSVATLSPPVKQASMFN
jgi:hypothetical protein